MEQATTFGQCPRCHSDQTAAIRILVEQGSTSGVGIGVSRGGIGVGSYGSTTGLAAKYAVGAEPRPVIATIFLVLSGIYSIFMLMALTFIASGAKGDEFFYTIFLGGVFFLLPGVSIALFCFMKIKGLAKETERWAQRKRLHDTGWACLRCGHDWIL
jgi:hypothetical protein